MESGKRNSICCCADGKLFVIIPHSFSLFVLTHRWILGQVSIDLTLSCGHDVVKYSYITYCKLKNKIILIICDIKSYRRKNIKSNTTC